MHFLLGRLLLFLALCLAASADISFDTTTNTRYKLHIRQSDDDDDVIYPCIPLCTAGGCNGDGSCTITKRDAVPLSIRHWNASELAIAPRSLEKRTLPTLTMDNIGDYYKSVTGDDNLTPNYTPLFAQGQPSNDECAAEQKTFAEYYAKGQPFTISSSGYTGDLVGCTIVTIVSRKAVWMAHLWERPSFESKANFQQDVLNFINGGDSDSVGPRPDVALFNTPEDGPSQTYVYIMHPCYDVNTPCPDRASSRRPRYRTRINALVTTLRSTIPGLAMDHIIPYWYRPDRGNYLDSREYDPTMPADQQYAEFEGRAMFQFDPQGVDGGDGRPDWRLSFEAALLTGRNALQGGDLDVS